MVQAAGYVFGANSQERGEGIRVGCCASTTYVPAISRICNELFRRQMAIAMQFRVVHVTGSGIKQRAVTYV